MEAKAEEERDRGGGKKAAAVARRRGGGVQVYEDEEEVVVWGDNKGYVADAAIGFCLLRWLSAFTHCRQTPLFQLTRKFNF